MGGPQRQMVDLHTACSNIFCRAGAGGMQHHGQHCIGPQGRHSGLLQGTLAVFQKMGGQRVGTFGVYGAVSHARQLGADKLLLICQNNGVKGIGFFRVCQKVSHTGALQPKTKNRAEIIAVCRQLITAGGKLQIRERLLLPCLGRLYAEDFSLRAVKPAPKADAVAPGPVAGGLRQTLLPVGEKARIARDTTAFADTAQLLNAAHQAALIIVLGRHKAADYRDCVGCIRRIHRYSPTRRSGHP